MPRRSALTGSGLSEFLKGEKKNEKSQKNLKSGSCSSNGIFP